MHQLPGATVECLLHWESLQQKGGHTLPGSHPPERAASFRKWLGGNVWQEHQHPWGAYHFCPHGPMLHRKRVAVNPLTSSSSASVLKALSGRRMGRLIGLLILRIHATPHPVPIKAMTSRRLEGEQRYSVLLFGCGLAQSLLFKERGDWIFLDKREKVLNNISYDTECPKPLKCKSNHTSGLASQTQGFKLFFSNQSFTNIQLVSTDHIKVNTKIFCYSITAIWMLMHYY